MKSNAPKSGGNDERRMAAHAALSDKVNVLRRWLNEGCPPGAMPPTSLNVLREWEDASLGLIRIGSPGTTNNRISPHNSDLISDAQSLIAALKLHRRRSAQRKGLPLQTQLENKSLLSADLQRQITTLTNQLVCTRQLLRTAQANERSALERCSRSEGIAADLRRQLVQAASGPLREV